eukprot:Amastigsp_a176036_25.p3 type:complete len:164 gc:universal Amastigsp_a176036_25:495-986(+)
MATKSKSPRSERRSVKNVSMKVWKPGTSVPKASTPACAKPKSTKVIINTNETVFWIERATVSEMTSMPGRNFVYLKILNQRMKALHARMFCSVELSSESGWKLKNLRWFEGSRSRSLAPVMNAARMPKTQMNRSTLTRSIRFHALCQYSMQPSFHISKSSWKR